MYQRYLEEAKHTPAPSTNWMADLMSDVRARHVNDLVTVRIEENLAASGSADASVVNTTKIDGSMPSPLGKAALSKVAPTERTPNSRAPAGRRARAR